MQLPTGYLQNLVDVLLSNPCEAQELLREWEENMYPAHWGMLKEQVEEHQPQLIVQHQDWMEWNDCDIPF